MALSATPTYSNVLKVKIGGVPLTSKQAQLLGASWVESSVNLPTAFHIMFNDNYQQLVKDFGETFRLGAKVEVYAISNGQGKVIPLMTGEITGIETDVDGPTVSTVIRGLDHSSKMMRRRRTKRYSELTATEIVRLLAAEDGVMVGPHVESSHVRYKTITQPNISDWQFVKELAARNGMYADFDNWGLLRFRRLPRPLEPVNPEFPEMPTILEVGGNARHCRIGITAADQVTRASVRGWDTESNVELKAESLAEDYRGRVIVAKPMNAVGTAAPLTYVETSTPYGSLAEVNQAADALAEEISSVFAELEVLADGNPALAPGQTVKLEKAGATFDGKYTVTTARHEFSARGRYMTWVSVTGHQVRNLYGLAAGASGPSNRIHGVVNAIVTDINDDRNEGRVKVKFPWLDDTYTTRWARTLQFGGHGGGGVISPGTGDEVLVAFDRGDIDYPYVLGGLYGHELNKPSRHDTDLVTAPGHLNRQSLVSRGGHRLELLDSDDVVPLHGVRLQSGDRALTVFLDEAETEIMIDSDGRVSITGKEKVSITSTGNVSVEAASVSIKAPKISLEGDVDIVGALTHSGANASFNSVAFEVDALTAVSISGEVEVALSSLGDINFKATVVTSEPFPV